MPKYVIERTIPGAGQMPPEELCKVAAASNSVLRELAPDVQWEQSYVADDKLFCVYIAAGEEVIREHGRRGGFPVDAIHQIHAVIDPTTGARQRVPA